MKKKYTSPIIIHITFHLHLTAFFIKSVVCVHNKLLSTCADLLFPRFLCLLIRFFRPLKQLSSSVISNTFVFVDTAIVTRVIFHRNRTHPGVKAQTAIRFFYCAKTK